MSPRIDLLINKPFIFFGVFKLYALSIEGLDILKSATITVKDEKIDQKSI